MIELRTVLNEAESTADIAKVVSFSFRVTLYSAFSFIFLSSGTNAEYIIPLGSSAVIDAISMLSSASFDVGSGFSRFE